MANTHLNKHNRIMALDVGDARVGVALSDPLRSFAQPKTTLANKLPAILRELLELVDENNVDTIVLGLPYELDGSIGPQAEKTKAFSEKLEKALSTDPNISGVEVVHWDERFSTAEAARSLQGCGLKNKERRGAQDRVAAALLLDGYLQKSGLWCHGLWCQALLAGISAATIV